MEGMTCAAHNGNEVLIQRSYWFRYFLGRIFPLLALLICLKSTARANICVSSTLHVRSVHGIVTDPDGQPIANAIVSLRSGKDTKAETRTDGVGHFRLNVSSGHYELYVHAPAFVDGWTLLQVGFSLRSLVHSNTLYVILAVGWLDCPPNLTTRKGEFTRQIQNFKAKYGAKKQENATQR
jgi:hypothetical protein